MPPGEYEREHQPGQPTAESGGGFSLRASAALVIAPAVLGLVVLGGSMLATGHAYPETVVAAVALLVVLVLALVGVRALVISLTRVRDSALTAANRILPERAERLREPREMGDRTPEEVVRDATDPVTVTVHDELGQVAYAVNSMYREALLFAAQQAQLRGDVNAMVFSLARRSQALVDKMTGVLAEIERAETDPARLTRLFELDRLAIRMRRNDENMLTIAGVDTGPVRENYLLLTELIAAAQREIEQHGRIDPGTVDSDVAVTAQAAGDVVRLIAELLDNATRFSPPSTAVLVDGRRIGDYVLVEIEDRGLGMSPSQLEAYNARLATPPVAEVSDCRMMGLAVVGRLAERHQIRVTLRAGSYGGTVASVTLPTSLLVLPARRFDRALPQARTPELPSAEPPRWPLAGTGRPAALPGVPAGLGALPPRTHALTAGPSAGGPAATGSGTGPAHAAADGGSAARAPANGTLPRHTELGPALALPAGTGSAAGVGSADGGGSATAGAGTADTVRVLPGTGAGGTGTPVAGDGDEPVIFKELRARWFGGAPQTVASGSAPAGKGWSESMDDEYGWRSAGDDGWKAATAAAQPQPAGTTPAGLPRRTPAAQLVPGAVPAEPVTGRRDADEVRGVLAAYHRGVQRGRGGGEAQSSGHPRSADEEIH